MRRIDADALKKTLGDWIIAHYTDTFTGDDAGLQFAYLINRTETIDKGEKEMNCPILANIAKALHTTTDYLVGNEKDSNDPELELEYNYTQRVIARNANRWSKKQKLDLVNALFENDD